MTEAENKIENVEIKVEDCEKKIEELLTKASLSLYNKFVEELKNKEIKSYITIVTMIMELIEKEKGLDKSKYDTFLEILQEIIKFGPVVIPSPQKEVIVPMLQKIEQLMKDELLKEIVDGLIQVSKGGVMINKVKKCCF